jgi:ribonuclease HII
VKNTNWICGIDEAGRGPVIGPMVIGCVILDDDGREKMKELNVRDSKKVAPIRRVKLEPYIKEYAIEWKTIQISASEIDRLRTKINLNAIEALKMSELIISLSNRPHKVIVDSADPVAENFGKRIIDLLKERNAHIPEIVSEHKADDNYLEVSAASILAKVERDREIEQLKEEYGNIGSGYPSDELTQAFLKHLKEQGELPAFVRRSWATADRQKQTSLGDYADNDL